MTSSAEPNSDRAEPGAGLGRLMDRSFWEHIERMLNSLENNELSLFHAL